MTQPDNNELPKDCMSCPSFIVRSFASQHTKCNLLSEAITDPYTRLEGCPLETMDKIRKVRKLNKILKPDISKYAPASDAVISKLEMLTAAAATSATAASTSADINAYTSANKVSSLDLLNDEASDEASDAASDDLLSDTNKDTSSLTSRVLLTDFNVLSYAARHAQEKLSRAACTKSGTTHAPSIIIDRLNALSDLIKEVTTERNVAIMAATNNTCHAKELAKNRRYIVMNKRSELIALYEEHHVLTVARRRIDELANRKLFTKAVIRALGLVIIGLTVSVWYLV